jgi:hypothetical protein
MIRMASFFVWFIWAICTVAAATVIWRQGPLPPWSDDWNMIPVIAGDRPLDLAWLFAQHNEHRIVLPKLVFVGVSLMSRADYRWLILVNLALLSVTAALFILTARKVRGRTRATDAFLPLLMLHLGQGALSWGFQFQFVSATVLSSGLLMLLLWQDSCFTPLASGLAAAGLLLLPLCGGNGLLYVPVLASSFGWHGFQQWKKNPDAAGLRDRNAGLCLLCAALGSCLLVGLYFIGYQTTPHAWPNAGIWLTLQTAGRLMTSAFGTQTGRYASATGWIIPGIVTGSFLWLLIQSIQVGGDRLLRRRVINLAVFFAAISVLFLAVGYGRGGRPWDADLAAHYANLALPALAAAYLSLVAVNSRFVAPAIQAGLLAAMSLLAWPYFKSSFHAASWRQADMKALFTDLQSGAPSAKICNDHIQKLFFIDSPETRILVETGIDELRRAGFARFGQNKAPQAP